MNLKYTVLTYIIGNYEKVHEIKFDTKTLTPNVEYLLVTDNENLKSDTWTVIYDKDLDNNTQTSFDKVFSIRYGLFKYATNDICLRIDGSIGINKPLTPIIKLFVDGGYDACLNIHPGRTFLIDEYNAWIGFRNFPLKEAQTHLDYIVNVLGYDIHTKGLIEQNFAINIKNDLTKNIDNDMLKILRNVGNGQCTRLDQTLFTAYLSLKHPKNKYMFVDDYHLFNDYMTWYQHASDNPYFVNKRQVTPFFNNEEVEIIPMKKNLPF